MTNNRSTTPLPIFVRIDESFTINITMFAWETLSITWNLPHPEDGSPCAVFHFKNQEDLWISMPQAQKIWKVLEKYLNWYNEQLYNQSQPEKGDTRKYAS
jgi:hypothetical protein